MTTPDSSGAEFLTREASIRTRAEGEASRSVDVVASTGEVDTYDTILDQESWELDQFERNPVVLYAHNRYDALPIGQASNVRVENRELLATLTFASAKANPLAEQVWQSIQEKTLRAVSVGFNCRNAVPARVNDQDVYILSGLRLCEISVVPLGGNLSALVKLSGRSMAAEKVSEVLNRARAVPRDPPEERSMAIEKGKEAEFAAEVLRSLKVETGAEALGVIATQATLAARCATAEGELTALRAAQDVTVREGLLLEARKDGRLSPAMEADAEFSAHLRSAPLPVLKASLRVLPKRAAEVNAKGGTGENSDGAADASGLTEVELKACREASITPEQFKAQKARDAGGNGVR